MFSLLRGPRMNLINIFTHRNLCKLTLISTSLNIIFLFHLTVSNIANGSQNKTPYKMPGNTKFQFSLDKTMKLILFLSFASTALLLCNALEAFIPTPMSWDRAMAECQTRNMGLTIARSPAKMREILDTMEEKGVKQIWLGVRRDSQPNQPPFVWRYRSILNITIERPFWIAGEPNNLPPGEECVHPRAAAPAGSRTRRCRRCSGC